MRPPRLSLVLLLVHTLYAFVYIPFSCIMYNDNDACLYIHGPLPGLWQEWFGRTHRTLMLVGICSLQTPENATLIDRGDDLDALYSRHRGEEGYM